MSRFNYPPLDRRARRITIAIIAIVALATGWMTWRYISQGGYYPAWFLTFALAIAALYILSIPRKIRLTEQAVEIRCIVEMTSIAREDIRAVRRLEKGKTHLFPLLGSYGFFGYYGYYLDWREWEIVRVYASRWEDLAEIRDAYDQRFVINDPGFLSEIEG